MSLAFDGKPLVRAAVTPTPVNVAVAQAPTAKKPVVPSRLVIPPKDSA
jgi:hypothetical protein